MVTLAPDVLFHPQFQQQQQRKRDLSREELLREIESFFRQHPDLAAQALQGIKDGLPPLDPDVNPVSEFFFRYRNAAPESALESFLLIANSPEYRKVVASGRDRYELELLSRWIDSCKKAQEPPHKRVRRSVQPSDAEDRFKRAAEALSAEDRQGFEQYYPIVKDGLAGSATRDLTIKTLKEKAEGGNRVAAALLGCFSLDGSPS